MDIVDISNIEANLVKFSKSEINLNAKLKPLCDQFDLKASEKELEFKCENALGYSDAFILTDGTKLLQIITNLVNNAIKFTSAGRVILRYEVKDESLLFSISDTGIGIPSEHLDKIFDRFYQVENTTSRVYEGTGLGLSITRAYVELMGGEIWLESEQGKGSTFYFKIPYEQAYTKDNSVSDRVSPDNQIVVANRRVLIAEDIESNFKLLKYFLSGTNIEILRASNGRKLWIYAFLKKIWI